MSEYTITINDSGEVTFGGDYDVDILNINRCLNQDCSIWVTEDETFHVVSLVRGYDSEQMEILLAFREAFLWELTNISIFLGLDVETLKRRTDVVRCAYLFVRRRDIKHKSTVEVLKDCVIVRVKR